MVAMRVLGGFILATMAGSVAAQPAVTATNAAYAPPPAGPEVVLLLVNDIRRDAGLSELRFDPSLTAAASRYAADLAARGELDHAGADGSAPPDRANAAGYPGRYVAENLAAGYEDATALVGDWMDSPSHRATILLEQARDVGVGHAKATAVSSETYWTLLVASPTVTTAQ